MAGSLSDVYITSTGSFLPGPPIDNDTMESILGFVNGEASRYRRTILRSNGIKQRHYALNDEGKPTFLAEKMAVNAINNALTLGHQQANQVEMIAAGTTMPDILAPGFASMVHGSFGGNPMDILSCAGICGAGAAALKAASNTVKIGQHRMAVSVAAERPSTFMRGSRFLKESQVSGERTDAEEGFQYFNADFLRWMLSDGAGAVVMENTPAKERISLKIEWIETLSFANELPTCMYLGTNKTREYGVENSWLWDQTIAEADSKGKLLLRQDVKLLGENIVDIVVRAAKMLKDKGLLNSDEVDHYLPHISSFFFRDKLNESMNKHGVGIDLNKWFTNLKDKGNTGSASIYIMLDEAYRNKLFKPGEKILLMIPESGRFSVTYAYLTAVSANHT